MPNAPALDRMKKSGNVNSVVPGMARASGGRLLDLNPNMINRAADKYKKDLCSTGKGPC